ncbi:putative dihydroflavonal-4-reductase protein [Rosellinia necatrix]|uniref:Putative dihydroflavonal-4-reductase protein n=1 Tax=Rosellinia necatrix TaxID=77044 RepID=A0A1W2TEL7_ROSNE|nr:putative dihydroflavonal-4-reductase protein [Rosellinia necatrix]
MPGTSQGHSGQLYGNSQRNAYHGSGNAGGQSGYRSGTVAPIQPYAFTSTPSLSNNGQLSPSPQGGYRTSSGTTVPTLPQLADLRTQPSSNTARSQTNTTPAQPTFAQVAASKASPERYRRPTPRQSDSSPVVAQSQQVQAAAATPSLSIPSAAQLYSSRAVPRSQGMISVRPQSAHGALTSATMDDLHLYRHSTEVEAKRYRRRSIHSINSPDYVSPPTPQSLKRMTEPFQTDALSNSRRQGGTEKDQRPTRIVPLPPPAGSASHVRNGSSESIVSSRSSNSRPSSSANRNSNASAPTGSPASTSSLSGEKIAAHDQPKLINIPPRGSSADVGKRVLSPSPLSNPATMASGSSSNGAAGAAPSPAKPSNGPNTDSPAAKQLAAINEKGVRSKSKTSRLRRAFSFGSAAELRKVTGQDINVESVAIKGDDPSRLHKSSQADDLYEEEQARIALKQEEGGIGSSIYSGTKLFAGSTDNLSISSTASSASIMLRKMGRGVKKGGRSLVGLFRPKSMIGSPNEELSAPEASQATVSMVTVEAERERVNVTTNADLTHTTGTGFPHLERNSIDATKNAEALNSDRLDASNENANARKSIIGGERERAEVLATIRKGILKTRSNSPTPPPRGAENRAPAFDLPTIPNVTDSPNSSAPSTPNDDVQGHKRNESVTIGNEDYFMSALRLRQDTKSAPGTPQVVQKRNATFSPRIVFHDTWPSGEYDRRGEVATCNRLTPMLAQQIKEELNSFKMEMEVHETSKIYTHFF